MSRKKRLQSATETQTGRDEGNANARAHGVVRTRDDASSDDSSPPPGAAVATGPPASTASPPAQAQEVIATTFSGPVPLLATKLFIPRPRADLVARPRLLEQLETGLRGPLTVLAAPAGWGKTSVLSAWWAGVQNRGASSWTIAWVSLDAGDNDPVRFWTYVLSALNAALPGLADDALVLLRAPQPPSIEVILTVFLNALVAAPLAAQEVVVLALDDYHVITVEVVHAAVAFLLDHLPSRLRLVISTREDPPLPLARRRAQGTVTELRAADLRFTLEETTTFLGAALGATLPPEAIAALEARSEGWIAGLQLAALSVQGRTPQQIASFLVEFAGSNRYIADYLVEEVLERQPPAIQEFVLRTAVLDRFCLPLVEQMLAAANVAVGDVTAEGIAEDTVGRLVAAQRPLTQALLGQVERANLFLIPLDDERRWYRYHHLFADVVRARLRQAHPLLFTELHRRASIWFQEHGLIEEAVEHALAAADFERAASLVEEQGFMLELRLNRLETALRWMSMLPEAVAAVHPLLKVEQAALLTYTYEPDAAEARLREAEAGLARGAGVSPDGAVAADVLTPSARAILGYVALIRGSVVSVNGDVDQALPLARQSFDLMPEVDSPWRLGAQVALANEYVITGDVGPATERQVSDAVAAARAAAEFRQLTLAALTIQGYVQYAQGRLRQALATFQEVPSLAVPPLTLANLPANQAYEVGLGELLREWNDFSTAEEHLREGIDEQGGRVLLPADTLATGYVALARLLAASGEPETAFDMLDAYAEIARQRGYTTELVERAAAARAQLSIATGDAPAAARWADASGLSPDDAVLAFRRELAYMAFARVRISQGRHDPSGSYLGEAARLLSRLLRDAEAKSRGHSVVEAHLLLALGLHARRDMRGALGALVEALTQAQPEGYVRLFADEGLPMASLLTELLDVVDRRRLAVPPVVIEYARFLLSVSRSPDVGQSADSSAGSSPAYEATWPPLPDVEAAPLLDPLTEREVEVLRLMAAGASNATIAAELVVAVGTAKKHVFNVCRKLGVQNRTQAVARAHALRLI